MFVSVVPLQLLGGEAEFSANLRDAMAKYNVTNLFDGMFTRTASSLMSKTQTLGNRAAKVRHTGPAPLVPTLNVLLRIDGCKQTWA